MIRGIKFVSIPVRDQDVAVKFFTEALGFKVTTDQPFTANQRWIELLVPGAESGLALFTPEGSRAASANFRTSHSGVMTNSQQPRCSNPGA